MSTGFAACYPKAMTQWLGYLGAVGLIMVGAGLNAPAEPAEPAPEPVIVAAPVAPPTPAMDPSAAQNNAPSGG
ncbi:MAG: hypothetical protein KA978_27880 [Deltaproteobacteria bacterium]|nr:hypothetical protein [Deltaproteobacteria bacterium]MBP6834635.1 hypothetical protein [Deltaproteobacteria bacterium]